MAIYVITGKLGAGKTLGAVSRIQEYLRQGRIVATNLDIVPERLLAPNNRTARVIRLPDKPRASDLDALGPGCEGVDEEKHGLIVLDELGSWLNSRDWKEAGRRALLDWLIHSRKHGFDVMFIVQDEKMMDAQIRDALMENLVVCKRLDKLRIPVVGFIARLLTFGAWDPRLPKIHLAVVHYSGGASISATNSMVVDRWVYRGHDLYNAYDTRQCFQSIDADDKVERESAALATGLKAHGYTGMFSYLPPWHVHGRYQPRPLWQRAVLALRAWWRGPARPRAPASRLSPLMHLSPDARWMAARHLVLRGSL